MNALMESGGVADWLFWFPLPVLIMAFVIYDWLRLMRPTRKLMGEIDSLLKTIQSERDLQQHELEMAWSEIEARREVLAQREAAMETREHA